MKRCGGVTSDSILNPQYHKKIKRLKYLRKSVYNLILKSLKNSNLQNETGYDVYNR